ncbi:sensor histidine kinase [Enterococcus sp. BWR-S5]|uniref:sensor histidine kinase n=1 Tax=Enterococcus sp. BWR-S5 TaxID=2787714 RepID=UPI001920D137|nr:sensor histidine kinase [Enterococcus sp. BWR-S5]MBL1224869.1 sensor histidine kinase [Enterococcus sp. BWR-S5]
MKEHFFEQVFLEASDSLYLLFETGEVRKNKAAVRLEEQVKVPLDRIVEIANGKGCVLHTTTEKCLNCEVKETWSPSVFPVVLETNVGIQERFSGSLSQVDDTITLLSLRGIENQEKMQQVIDNKRLIEYVNQAHETERRAISQELHDGLAQSIYSLMLDVRQLKRMENKGDIIQRIGSIDEDFVSLLQEVKQIAIDLRPTALDDLGLVPAIEALLHRIMETTGLIVHFIPVLSQQRFSERLETVTYRVLQESVMNSVKYAAVDELWVTLREHEGQLILEVRDHGIGFSPTVVGQASGAGLGLLHMQERAESVGGSFKIHSEVGEGTTVSLKLPID